MTKEEQQKDDIETMKILFNADINELSNQRRFNDAREMEGIRDRIIQALEQQPSEDCIRREAVINLINHSLCDLKRDGDKQIFINTINSLPSVTPQTVTEFADKCKECGKIQNELAEDAVSRQDVDAYIAKLMSGYLYDEERTRLEEFSAYLWELPSVTPRTNLAETSQDCISRSELLRHQHIIYDDDGEGYRAVYVKDIKAMPSVTPERPKGKWIELYTGNYKCSVCGDWWDNDNNEIVEDFKYCPNCGAEMSGGGEDDLKT